MRIVHLDAGMELRGGQVQLAALARAEPRPLAVIVRPDAPVRGLLERHAVPVVCADLRGRWWGTRAIGSIAAELGADVIAAHDGHGAALALRQRRIPVIVHRRVDFAPSGFGYRRYRKAAGVVAVSAAVEAILRRGGVERIRVVHDGVDAAPILATPPDRDGVRAELGLPAETPLVVAVGALVAHKGHVHLVDAMARLPRPVSAAILGEGPERAALAARIRALGLADRVHLVGRRDDVARWLRSADAFAHPSVEEGLGQAVIEAVVAGLPGVITRAGGLPELGIADVGGDDCAPADPIGLAAAIAAALSRARPDQAAVARFAERWSVGRMVAATHRAYAAFLGD